MRRVRKHLGTIIGIVISLGAMLLAVRGLPLAEVESALAGANYWYLLPAAVLLFISYITRALRWNTLLRRRVSLTETFHAMNAGYILNNVLPLRLGEVARAYLLSRGPVISGAEALSTIVAERVLDLLSAVIVIAISLPLVAANPWMRSAGWSAGVVAVGGLLALWLAAYQRERLVRWAGAIIQRLPRLSGPLSRLLVQADLFLEGLQPLRDARLLLTASAWSGVTWLLAGLVNWLVLAAFVPGPSLALGLYVLGVAAVAYAVPSSPGQAGVLEAAIVAGLLPLGIAQSTAFSYAVVLHLLIYAVTSLLGAWALSHYGETLAGVARAAQNFLGRRKSPALETPYGTTDGQG